MVDTQTKPTNKRTRFRVPIFALGFMALGAAAFWLLRSRPGLAGGLKNDKRKLLETLKGAIAAVVTNPGSVSIQVRDGKIILTGPILKAEHKAAIMAIYGVPEVHDVVDALEVHESSAGVPGLQGHREWDTH